MNRMLTLARKAASRSPQELRERLEQKLAVVGERVGLRATGEPNDTQFLRRLQPDVAKLGLSAFATVIRDFPRPPFFPGVDDLRATSAFVRERWPARARQRITAANEIIDGRFQLLGYPPLHFPDPIDWHRDPIANVRAPLRHWSTIAFLDPAVAGDHKLVWELNRHQFLVSLGLAFQLTDAERYAAHAARLLHAWMDANPPQLGVNWASSLEVSYRAIAWTWALRLMRSSRAFDAALILRVLKYLEASGRHIERYLSTYFSPNTHLTGEALGLLYLGTQFPEFAASKRWAAKGWSILVGQLQRQVRPDGSYFEQATYYHRYTLDIYIHARTLGSGVQFADVALVDDAINRLAEFLAWTMRAEGAIPHFGDEDGGRLLFPEADACEDVRASIAAAAALVSNPKLATAASVYGDEVAWLLGKSHVTDLDRLPRKHPAETSRAFLDGGFFVMRDGWSETSDVLTIDCGPLGADNGGHAHADTLAFELSLRGVPVIVDAGTVSYTTDSAERDRLRHSAVHNTVTLDGVSSSATACAFQWQQMTPGVLDAWHDATAGTYFEGHHDGYRRLPAPARHRRIILMARSEWVVVRDIIEGTGEHEAVANFQFAPGLDVSIHGDALRVSDDGRELLAMTAFESLGDGRWEEGDGIASRRYGSREVARRASRRFAVRGTSAVTYVLVRGDVGAAVEIAHERAGRGEVFRVRAQAHEDVIVFDADTTEVQGIRSDARMIWVRRRRVDSVVESLMAVGGTVAEVDGAMVARPDGGAVSAVQERGTWRVASGAPTQRSLFHRNPNER